MPFSIELRFDPTSEDRIRRIWENAAIWHGSNYLLENGVIPHVALLVGDSRLKDVFAKLEAPSGVIFLSGTGFFGEGEVAFLPAEIPESIRGFQRAAHQIALDAGAAPDPHYAPEVWIPHCTIAMNCRNRRGEPFANHEIMATIHRLILVEYPPTMLVAEKAGQSHETRP